MFDSNKTLTSLPFPAAISLPKPQVGRKLWLWGAPGTVRGLDQPFDASIAFVDNTAPGGERVTVHYRDHAGAMLTARSVPVRGPLIDHHGTHGVADSHATRNAAYATWLPHQVGPHAGSAA